MDPAVVRVALAYPLPFYCRVLYDQLFFFSLFAFQNSSFYLILPLFSRSNCCNTTEKCRCLNTPCMKPVRLKTWLTIARYRQLASNSGRIDNTYYGDVFFSTRTMQDRLCTTGMGQTTGTESQRYSFLVPAFGSIFIFVFIKTIGNPPVNICIKTVS